MEGGKLAKKIPNYKVKGSKNIARSRRKWFDQLIVDVTGLKMCEDDLLLFILLFKSMLQELSKSDEHNAFIKLPPRYLRQSLQKQAL